MVGEDWLETVLAAVVSEYQRTGYFDKVNTHEPRKKPGRGLHAAIWPQSIGPVSEVSGVASTCANVVFLGRMYKNISMKTGTSYAGMPDDAIDPMMLEVTSRLIRMFHDDFDFGGVIRNVDLLGQFGPSLSAQAGYLDQDNAKFRIMDLTIPCIVNDVWPQVSGS